MDKHFLLETFLQAYKCQCQRQQRREQLIVVVHYFLLQKKYLVINNEKKTELLIHFHNHGNILNVEYVKEQETFNVEYIQDNKQLNVTNNAEKTQELLVIKFKKGALESKLEIDADDYFEYNTLQRLSELESETETKLRFLKHLIQSAKRDT